MTDPMTSLQSMQQELLVGHIQLTPGIVDPNTGSFADKAGERVRFSYVRREGSIVTAFVAMVLVDPVDASPCFQAGVAVPKKYRGQGRAKSLLEAAIAEMAAGFGRAGIPPFYVEAIVSVDNAASNAICSAVISDKPEKITDGVSNEPALHYIRKVETTAL